MGIKSKKPARLGEIKAQELPPPQISFSLKYLSNSNNKFICTAQDAQYFLKLLERLKALCQMKSMDLLASRSSALRCHPINWPETTESGFGIPKGVGDDVAVQFEISMNSHGRVHGFFIGEIFYVVWLDPFHRLYS